MTAPFLFVPTFSWPATPGGLLYTYAAGGVTPLATYSDAAGSIPNTNPVVLDANGSATIRLSNSAYHFVLMDPTGSSTVWDQDQYVPEYLTLGAITTLLNPQTAAESAAFVNPSNLGYLEGDIRRYGALTTATDNSGAINAALLVSSNGGNAAFIPGGTWNITSSPQTAGNSSMYGTGSGSVLFASGCHGLTLNATSGYSTSTAPNSFFKDFSLVGALPASSTFSGIYSNLSAGQAAGVRFDNIGISSFLNGATILGLRQCTFTGLFVYNVCNGLYFPGSFATTNIEVSRCSFIRGGTMGNGSFGYASGISMPAGAAPPESIQCSSNYWFDFDRGLDVTLVEEMQVEHCDISNCLSIGISVTSTIDGFWVRDCWIETNANALTYGIKVPNITPSTFAKIHFIGNYINCDQPFAGSTGISIGNANNGAMVEKNMVHGFDVGIFMGACAGASVQKNTINATTTSLSLDSLSTELDLGPNYIVSGGQATFTSTPPTNMRYEQPNAPMKGSAAFVAATSAAVAFTNALPAAMTNYRVALSGNAAGYCWVTGKTNAGFTINCSASNSNSVDWTIKA